MAAPSTVAPIGHHDSCTAHLHDAYLDIRDTNNLSPVRVTPYGGDLCDFCSAPARFKLTPTV